MKSKLLYILLLGFIGLGSCKEDFLNVYPETSVSSASFYKTVIQFDQALVASYGSLRSLAFEGIFMDEMRSDNTFFDIYAGDRGSYLGAEVLAEFLDDKMQSQEANNPGNRYADNYVGISRVNTILTRIGSADISQKDKDRIMGEALFLRAFYYFDLVTHFGGVPLHIEEVTSESGAFLPRSTVEETYTRIITDLTNAIPILPVATVFPQSGRATKGAAKMLLAYAYMSKPTREYSKAESELLDITKMNYALLEDYNSIFSPTDKNNKESIFEVQYKAGDLGQESSFIDRFIPKTTNTEAILGIHENNIRGGLQSGSWNIPTQEMVDSYEPDDLRLSASIAVAEGIQKGDFFTTEAVKDIVGYTPMAGKVYYYFIKKYLHLPRAKEWNGDDNWPVYRYSGALLLLAECLVEQNKNGEALPYLNQVRKRAGLPELSEATKENVANETRHELAFENHRWTDLIRTGKAIEVMTKNGEEMKKLHPWILPAAFNISEYRLIYPIPFREMNTNKYLVQNPEY